MTEDLSYAQALGELEAIVKKMEDPNLPLPEVGEDIKRAMALIARCRGELAGYRKEFNSLIEE